MDIDEIRSLCKKEMGYERHVTLLGKKEADGTLYHIMLGFKLALKNSKKT